MINFDSDYMEGAHPSILKRLQEINFNKTVGYGEDDICESARNKIRSAIGIADADVFFLVGGTQTNAFVIDAILDKCDGVLCVESGHIAGHEAGAVEAWGHKVLTIPGKDGKISAESIKKYYNDFYSEHGYYHMVAPGMVYISNPTEMGTLYTYKELKEIKAVCEECELPLFVDGARLGYALGADCNDVTLSRLASCCDVFYIGGTKVGALFGEAVVTSNKNIFKKRIPLIKRHGALLAKGWLLGLQFDTLFTDDLYIKISRNAIDKAMKIRDIFLNRGYELAVDSRTNQQFFIVNNDDLDRIAKYIGYTHWSYIEGNKSIIRLVTSWATTDEQVSLLADALDLIAQKPLQITHKTLTDAK